MATEVSGKGVLVNLKQENRECTVVSIWCSGKLMGWVSARNKKETIAMAKATQRWYGLVYDHDKFGPLMELNNGEEHLKNLLGDGYSF